MKEREARGAERRRVLGSGGGHSMAPRGRPTAPNPEATEEITEIKRDKETEILYTHIMKKKEAPSKISQK